MADALTTTLHRAGEVPDARLQICELAQAFARLILCLRSVRRAQAQLRATSLADLAYAGRLTTAEERWAELTARLEFLGEFSFTPRHPNGMLIQASRLMRTWLCAQAGRGNHVGAGWLVAEEVRLMPQGESRLARQTGLLVQEALDLFKAIPGPARSLSDNWAACKEHLPARPLLGRAGGRAHLRATVAEALVRPAPNMSARSLCSATRFTLTA